MTSLGCLEKDTQISELVGVPLWLLTGQELVSLGHPETLPTNKYFREFISLNLALTAASGIDFPCSSFCI